MKWFVICGMAVVLSLRNSVRSSLAVVLSVASEAVNSLCMRCCASC